MIETQAFTASALARAYGEGLRPEAVIAEAFRRLEAANDPGIFINTDKDAALDAARALGTPDGRPLWGVPFAVKDNIDVAGLPTTAACPDFAYTPERDAFVVARLKAAGAICIGKTNLDQFATGLVGVRTPYPVPRNALDATIVPGGSSSGSAVSVAHGICGVCAGYRYGRFGTRAGCAQRDRRPKADAGIALGKRGRAGLPDTRYGFDLCADGRGCVGSTGGRSRARCSRRLFARPCPMARSALCRRHLRIGVPNAATLIGDAAQKADFARSVERLRAGGAAVVELDFTRSTTSRKMLYEGAWLAERVVAVGNRLTDKPRTLHPTTRAILEPGLKLTAADAFRGDVPAEGTGRRMRGYSENSRCAVRADDSGLRHTRRNRPGPDRAEFPARDLHQFRQPARYGRHCRADGHAGRWPAGWRDDPCDQRARRVVRLDRNNAGSRHDGRDGLGAAGRPLARGRARARRDRHRRVRRAYVGAAAQTRS
jgi:allophanate hydrolase